jgi:hypothetical protein
MKASRSKNSFSTGRRAVSTSLRCGQPAEYADPGCRRAQRGNRCGCPFRSQLSRNSTRLSVCQARSRRQTPQRSGCCWECGEDGSGDVADNGLENHRVKVLTAGEIFDDSLIELIRNTETGGLKLLVATTGKATSSGPQIEHRGTIYVPLQLEPSLLRSLTLPAGIADYGTPLKLFDALACTFS